MQGAGQKQFSDRLHVGAVGGDSQPVGEDIFFPDLLQQCFVGEELDDADQAAAVFQRCDGTIQMAGCAYGVQDDIGVVDDVFEPLGFIVDVLVGAELQNEVLVLGGAGGDRRCAEVFGDLDGVVAYSASAGVDENFVSFLYFGVGHQRLPGGEGGEGSGGGFFVRAVGGFEGQLVFGSRDVFCIGFAVTCKTDHAEDLVSFFEPRHGGARGCYDAGDIPAQDHRRFSRLKLEHEVEKGFITANDCIYRIDADRFSLYEYFIFGRLGDGELGEL